jgi:hypothetical protein
VTVATGLGSGWDAVGAAVWAVVSTWEGPTVGGEVGALAQATKAKAVRKVDNRFCMNLFVKRWTIRLFSGIFFTVSATKAMGL